MPKMIITLMLLLMFLTVVSVIHADEKEKHNVMPEELVEVAERNDYTQIDDFYDRPGSIGPCFLYGIDSSKDIYDSAVFWGKKFENNYWENYLIFVERKIAGLEIVDEIRERGTTAGLSIYCDSTLTLDQFRYLDNLNDKGPEGVHLEGIAIEAYYDGLTSIYYKYRDNWLIRVLD